MSQKDYREDQSELNDRSTMLIATEKKEQPLLTKDQSAQAFDSMRHASILKSTSFKSRGPNVGYHSSVHKSTSKHERELSGSPMKTSD